MKNCELKIGMQADYPKRGPSPSWDPVRVTYPVRKFPETGESSETIARVWRSQPETLMGAKTPLEEIKEYMRDYNVTKGLSQSQSTKDFGYKAPDTKRFNKHTACTENQYIYPLPRKIEDRPPQTSAHAVSLMKSSYTPPTTAPRLVTDKDQYKHPASLPPDPHEEPSWQIELPPLDTTHDGYEKHLDPYLTTSRLHHRPFTADQVNKQSASKDTITYYTYSKDPWVRTPKHNSESWRLPLSRPKTMYDREKFKEDFREIRTHNSPKWVPSSFRTEARDHYRPQSVRLSGHVEHLEEDVRNYYHRLVAHLPTNVPQEYRAIRDSYQTENSHSGSGRPLCAVVDQHVEINKKLESRNKLGVGR